MDEQLTVDIGGRRALPVRAIPYVTGWWVGDLVQDFSRKVGAPFERLQDVYAYHLSSGQPVKYLPREWDGIQINLDALGAELHEKFKIDDQGFAAWQKEAVSILPEGVFVWLDEFEKDWVVNSSPSRISIPNERVGDRELNYTPHITSETREMVLAGFDEFYAKPAKAEALPITQDDNASGETKLDEINFDSSYVPANAIGKLAITAATELEKESRKLASAKQVIELLQKWATDVSNSALNFPLFVNFSNGGNKAQAHIFSGFFERPLANVRAVWWKKLDAV